MKRLLTIMMIAALCISMMAPQVMMPQAAFAAAAAEVTGEPGEPGEPEAAKEYVIDPYLKVRMDEAYDNGKLVLPDGMKDSVTVSRIGSEPGSGILLKGKVGDLQSGRIVIDNEFDFDSGKVGRFSFDGLKDKDAGMKVTAGVYLDNADTPFITVDLRKQMGSQAWEREGEKSFDLTGKEITGKHRVSIGLTITGKKEDKKTTVALRAFEFCKTAVPVLYFNIDETEGTVEAMNSSPDHSAECYGTVDLRVPDEFNNDDTFRDEYKKQSSIEGLVLEYIRGRGNSTWDNDKKPYKVKFDKAQDLFGFGKNKHWVLLADRYDNSLVRNRMTYWIGRKLGMEYTPQCVPVEVVMNGEYYGSYLLCEQVRVGEGRVEIDDLDKEDDPMITEDLKKTGGYLLSMDWGGEDEERRLIKTSRNMQFYIESPEDNLSDIYKEYIRTFVQKMEDCLFGKDFKSEGRDYKSMLDMRAAVDYWWLQEFSANGDAYTSGSTYLYKKRDVETETGKISEKLYWGPLWDFDYVAWGDLDYEVWTPEGLDNTSTAWSTRMKSDPEFIEMVKSRWSEEGGLKDLLEQVTMDKGLLDRYEAQLAPTYKYNLEKWGPFESELTSLSGEIGQLRRWIEGRIEKVDTAVKDLDVQISTVKFVLDGNVIKTEEYTNGEALTGIPEAPEKKGYIFVGWFDEEYGMQAAEGSEIYSDTVYVATYIKKSEAVQPKNLYFRTYDVYELYFGEDSEDEYQKYGMEYTVMPEDSINNGITWSSDSDFAPVDEMGTVTIKGTGDAVITGTLSNGVKKSYRLHIYDGNTTDFSDIESIDLSREKLSLKTGGYSQVTVKTSPELCYESSAIWISTDEDIATVDALGVVSAKKPGKTTVIALVNDGYSDMRALKCKVDVTAAAGYKSKVSGSTYKVTSAKSSDRRVMLVKAKNVSNYKMPDTVKIGGKTYKVTKIGAKAFTGSKIKTVTTNRSIVKIDPYAFKSSKAAKLTVRTKKLSKKGVKNSLRGSKVKTVKVSTDSKKSNRQYVTKYKKIFTKKNAGKKVSVR